MNVKLWHYVSVGTSAFLGGGLTWLEANMMAPAHPAWPWGALGFTVAGLIAVTHLIEPSPLEPSNVPPGDTSQ